MSLQDIADDLDTYGYPENDNRRGISIFNWWRMLGAGECGGALGMAVSIPWLSSTLAVICICIFIWEIDYRVHFFLYVYA